MAPRIRLVYYQRRRPPRREGAEHGVLRRKHSRHPELLKHELHQAPPLFGGAPRRLRTEHGPLRRNRAQALLEGVFPQLLHLALG